MRLSLTFLFLVLLPLMSFGQYTKYHSENKRALGDYEEARQYLKRAQFREAMEPLRDAVDRDPEFVEAWLSLGSACYRLSWDSLSIAYFETAIKIDPDYHKSKYAYYIIGELKLKQADYQYAHDYFEHYIRTNPADPIKVKEAKKRVMNCRFAIAALKHPYDYNIKELPAFANIFQLQYFPAYSVDQNEIYFTRRIGMNNFDDEDIYYCVKDSITGGWSKPESISENINSEYNEGAASLSADGRMIVFTSCDGRKGYGSCDIYISEKEGEDWGVPKNIGPEINSAAWDAQPTLSADGRTMLFVSNRQGGYGGKDIWIAQKNKKGKWQQAYNLGKRINTDRDEISPFLHTNGETIYFASEGHEGFGGLDIFRSEIEHDSIWEIPANLGAPLNDSDDQVSLHIASNGKEGLYTIEKVVNSAFESKLYSFDLPDTFSVSHQSAFLKGTVTDRDTGTPLASKIRIYRLADKNYYSELKSDKVNGGFTLVLTEGYKYGVYVTCDGYMFKDFAFTLEDIESFDNELLNIQLDPIKVGVTSILGNIFFDYNEYTLKGESMSELRIVYYFLKKNPEVKVEIGGHTDSKGETAYNMSLSEKRAQTVYDFLVSKGVRQSQLSFKGYGKSQPLKKEFQGENEERNRRIEFKVVNIGD
ncbi:MAG: OmpA family protein [Reichenbachiella sp.]